MKKPSHIKHTIPQKLLFVGLDVHAQTITAAVAESRGEARLHGSFPNDLHALELLPGRVCKEP